MPIYETSKGKYNISEDEIQEFLAAFPDAKEVKTSGVDVGTAAPAGIVPNTELNLANGFLEPRENVFENSVLQFVSDKIGAIGQGVFELAEGFADFIEMPVDVTAQKTIDIYNYFADEDVTQAEREAVSKRLEDLFVLDEAFGFAADQFEKLKTVRDDKTIAQRLADGEYLTALDQTISGVAGALPSLGAALLPGGIFALGASSAGSHYEELSEARPEDIGFKMLGTAALQGTIEMVSERVTRGLFKNTVKILGGQTKETATKGLQLLGKNMFFEGASEVAANEANNVISQTWGLNRYYDQEGNFDSKASLQRMFDTFLISSLTGAVGTGGAAISANQNKLMHERLMPQRIFDEVTKAGNAIETITARNKGVDSDIAKKDIEQYQQYITNQKAKVGQVIDSYTSQEKADQLKIKSKITDLYTRIKNEDLRPAQKDLIQKEIDQLKKQSGEFFDTKFKQLEEQNISRINSLMGRLGFSNKVELADTDAQAEKITGQKAGAEGLFMGNGKIVINRAKALDVANVTTASHELLHPILNALVGDANQQKQIVSEFKNQLTKSQLKWVETQLDINKIEGRDRDTEFINYFSDGVLSGQIAYDKTIFTRIANFFNALFKKEGFENINFDTGEGVYNFIKQYNKTVKEGVNADKIAQVIKEREAKRGIKVAEVDIVSALPQESRSNVANLLSKYDSPRDMVSRTLTPTDADFSDYRTSEFGKEIMPIVEAITKRLFDKIPADATRVINENRNEARKEYQNALITEGATIVSNEFKAEALGEGQTIDNFVSNRLNLRANDLAKRLGVQETIVQSLDVVTDDGPAVQVESTYTDYTTMLDIRKQETERQAGLIDPVELLGESRAEEYYNIVAEKVRNGDFTGLTFATAKDAAPAITAAIFGTTEKKATSAAANLSKGEIPTIQRIIRDNVDALIRILPDGAILEGAPASEALIGTGLKLPGKLLEAFYDRGERLTKGAGLIPYTLKPEITKKQFLETFGIKADGTLEIFGGKDPRAQAMLSLVRLSGQLMTNTAARAEMQNLVESGQYTVEQIQDLAAGKSEAQKSETLKMSDQTAADLNQDSSQSEARVEGFANEIIPRLRRVADSLGIEIPERDILLADRSKGAQEFSLSKANKFYDTREDIMDFFPPIATKFKGLVNSILGSVYREDGSYFKFSKTDYKKLLDDSGNVITDPATLKEFENRSLAATKNPLLNSEGKADQYSDATKELIVKVEKLITEAKLGGKTPNNHGKRIKDAKGGLTPIASNENVSATLEFLSKNNKLNNEIAKLYISLFRDYVNSSDNKADAVEAIMIMLTANRNTVDAFRSLSSVERIIYDANNPTSYHLEHDKSMALVIEDIFKQILSDGPITFDSTASLIPVEIAKLRDSKSETKVSDKPIALGIYADSIEGNKNLNRAEISNGEIKISQESRTATISEMIERTSGIDSKAEISEMRADLLGKNKGKWKFFIPPSADDFMGLMYYMVGKGKQGDKDLAWIKENISDPFAKGIHNFTQYRQGVMSQFRSLKKLLRGKNVKLKETNSTGFSNEVAVRVYIWATRGFEIPGLTRDEVTELTRIVSADSDLRDFASQIMNLTSFAEAPAPEGSWGGGTLTTDILDYLNTSSREKFLEEYLANIEEIFGKIGQSGKLEGPIANKLKAAYGENYVEALSDVIYRMKTGRRRITGNNKLTNQFVNWINDSVGAIMFFNTRSALLQQLSLINFINFSDNNPLAASAAFINQKQFWKDYVFLFNSDFLKERRSGLKTDVNADEIAKAAAEGKNSVRGVVASLLKKGFLPTQIADSHAISIGGASFYRNRINRYLKEGKSQQEAEQQAFLDFQEIAEESQQSSRPDRISMQQASGLGRLILAFANTPMQYARLTKKAALDLANRRGDWKTNLSKLMYYGAVQNIVFSTLQSALFALAFDDEEEEEKRSRYFRIGNSTADGLLRGLGFGGAAVATGKNMVLEAINQYKSGRPNYEKVALKSLSLSPPIDSKVRKLASAGRSFTYRNTREKMLTEGFSLDNPIFDAAGQVISATTNLPADRVIRKLDNLSTPVRQDVETWQAISLALGYSKWDVGLIDSQAKKPQTKTSGLKRKKVVKKKKVTKKKII